MRTVTKVMALLETLGERGEAGVSELARQVGADKAAVHRILQTLSRGEWVRQDPASRLYHIGPALSELTGRMPTRPDVIAAAGPILDDLARQLDETSFLSSRQGSFNVVELIRETTQEVRVVSEVGKRIPLHGGAAGKALLAFERSSIRDKLFDAELAAFPDSIPDPERLRDEMEQIRERGWSYDDGETTPGVCGLAAPVLLRGHLLLGCIAVRAPSTRLDLARAETYAPTVVEAANRLARNLLNPAFATPQP